MAELNVQPKKKTSFLPWLLLLLAVIAAIWFFTRKKDNDHNTQTTSGDTATTSSITTAPADHTSARSWSGVDFNAPALTYEEVTDRNIEVRGNKDYGIYALGETILFDEGKASIRADAASNLKQIVTSINKRYNDGEIRIYGYTDAQGSAGANQELAQQRADAVKTWLQNNGVDAGRISVNAIGEAKPVASNSTQKGRQQNRRVEIVARSSGNNGSA